MSAPAAQRPSRLRLPSRNKGSSPAASAQSAPRVRPSTPGHKPSALLVPERVVDSRAKGRQGAKLLAAAAGVLVLGVAATVGLGVVKASQDARLETISAANETMRVRASALAPVGAFYTGFASRQGAVSDQLVSDVAYDRVLEQITLALPEGTSLTSVSTTFGQTCAGPNPYDDAPGVGCVTLTAAASGLDDAGRFVSGVEALAPDQSVVLDPYVTRNEAEAEGGAQFTATVNFNNGALSSRFEELLPRKDESAELDTETAPVAPATGASDEQGEG